MQQQASVEIDRAIEDVFEYTNTSVAEWSLTVVEEVPVETMPDGGVGSTFRCVTQNQGSKMEFAGTVTKWERPTLSAIHLEGQAFDIDALYTFEDLGHDRTRVTQVSVVQPNSLITKVIFFVAGKLFRKAGCEAAKKELVNLKEKLEAG